ncbi:amidohydrolase [Marinilactibacillus sp. Marseille-P9653]|uniref:amidohydrolase n=1 Tax=Marinilactibacillus sp. Marseille-P9653 TaxID=2866583 RepID=UPI001CE41C2D|nr:amidohydrolase [Marinilactibacillus sp. Marseille-P9653]
MKTLIKNVHVLTMDIEKREYPKGYILIEDSNISSVGSMEHLPEEMEGTEVIDGHQAIAMPGMINTHTHVGMIPFRSLGDDYPDRLRRFLFPLEKDCMTAELAYHSGKYAIAEMQLAGVTTFMDMYYFEDAIAQATEEMGSRAILGETVIDFPTCDTTTAHGGLDYARSFIPKWLNHELITPAIAPHAPNTNSPEALQEAVKLSEMYQVPITMHVSEMDYEQEYFQNTFGQTPVEFLSSIGALTNRFVAAHCIHLSDKDIELLKDHKVSVAHCIGANTKSAKGVARVKDLLEQGIPVGLGTDGPSSGNTLDLFTQMKLFANFHKTNLKDRSAFPASEIVELATMGGAKVLGLQNKVGSLETGKKADIVLVETQSVNMFPIFDPYAALVYSANASNVQDVFIHGKRKIKDKQLNENNLNTLRQNLFEHMEDFTASAKDRL